MSNEPKSRVICIEITGDDEAALQSAAESLGEILDAAAKSFELPDGVTLEEMDIFDPDEEDDGDEMEGAGDGV